MKDGLSAAGNFNRSVIWSASWCSGGNDCLAHLEQRNKSGIIYRAWFFCCRLFLCSVGAFGFTLISDFLLEYQIIINIFGGVFILFMGVRLLLKKNEIAFQHKSERTTEVWKMFFSSFAIGITNPTAILTFLFAFSYFGISAKSRMLQGIMLVSGVFIGTYIWWGTLTAVTNSIKRKTGKFSFQYMNRVFGMILCLFGAGVLVRLFF